MHKNVRLFTTTIAASILAVSTLAGAKVDLALNRLKKLGYSTEPTPSSLKANKLGDGQELLRQLKHFSLDGKYKKIWDLSPMIGLRDWHDLTKTEQHRLTHTYLKNPDFVGFYVAFAKASQMDCSIGADPELRHGSKLRSYARFLAQRSDILLRAGHVEEALKCEITSLRFFQKSLGGQSGIIWKLVYKAVLGIHHAVIERLLQHNESPERGLRELTVCLSKIDVSILTKEMLQHEVRQLANLYRSPDRNAELRKTFDQRKDAFEALKASYKKQYPPDKYKKIVAYYNQSHAEFIENEWTETFSQLVDAHALLQKKPPYGEQIKAFESLDDRYFLIYGFTWKAYVQRDAEMKARIGLLKTGIACQLYYRKNGTFPNRLSDLPKHSQTTDPYTGKSILYRKVGRKAILYAIGPDLRDDKGMPFDRKSKTGDHVLSLVR